jgi:hypothetical protein
MKRIQIAPSALILIFLGISTAAGDIVLKIEDQWFYPGSNGNSVLLILENPKDELGHVQTDILFDIDCFSVTDVIKTERSRSMDIFNYSHIPNGIRIAMTGISHVIGPGHGPIADIILKTIHHCDGQYLWDITCSIAADPLGGEIEVTEIDGYIDVFYCDPFLSLSDFEFDFGDVWIGQAGIGTLYVSNVGCGGVLVVIETEGCAMADPSSFEIEQSDTQAVSVYCRPEVEGACTGALLIQTFGYYEVSVTCNGVTPTGTKGDVNDDGTINVRDAILCINHILGLWPFEDPNRLWAADCNGPLGDCDGDGMIDVLDALKIVNIILELDECLPDNVIYFNSFESDEDTTGWRWLDPEMFVKIPAPGGGKNSLHIGGGCTMPTAFLTLPPQYEEGNYLMSCWGKIDESSGGRVYLTTSDVHNDSVTVRLDVHSLEWQFLQTETSLHCSMEDTMRIEIWIGGIVPNSMYIDLLKVEKVE